jgi:translation initiation factor IF-2
VPEAGDDFVVVEDERLAKDVAQRETKRRESRLVATAGSRMEDIMATLGKGEASRSSTWSSRPTCRVRCRP